MLDRILFYDTVQVVRLKSRRVAVLYNALVGAIIAWIIYSLVSDDGHQASCPAVVSRSLKIKGVGYTEPGGGGGNATRMTYDATDLVTTDSMGFFVPLGMRQTTQRRGRCASTEGPACNAGNATVACAAGEVAGLDGGILTGGCSLDEGLCEVEGWCPGEVDSQMLPIMNAMNFTAFVRINVRFPCGHDGAGIPKHANNLPNSTALTPGINLFTLGEIVDLAGVDRDSIQEAGADIVMSTAFDCDLDRHMRECAPEPFSATRIDDAAVVSSGYNIRRAYVRQTDDERVLQKLVGVRVRVQVNGRGRHFDLLTLVTHFGSGLALIGLATVMVDFIMSMSIGDDFTRLKYHECQEEEFLQERAGEHEPLLAPVSIE